MEEKELYTCTEVAEILDCGVGKNQMPVIYKFLKIPAKKLHQRGCTVITGKSLKRIKEALSYFNNSITA